MSEKLKLEVRLNYGQDLLAGGAKEVTSPPLEFTVEFNTAKDKSYNIDLNGAMLLGDHGQLILHQLEMEPQNSYLTFDFLNEEGKQLHYMATTLTTDKGDERWVWMLPEPTGKDSPFYIQ